MKIVSPIEIPFIIGHASRMYLYVTTVHTDGREHTKETFKVELMAKGNVHKLKQRVHLFSILIFFLGKLMKTATAEEVETKFDDIKDAYKNNDYRNVAASSKRPRPSVQSSSNTSTGQPTLGASTTNQASNVAERSAMAAASQGGVITNLQYPFSRVMAIGEKSDYEAECDYYQQQSPFFFTGTRKMIKHEKSTKALHDDADSSDPAYSRRNIQDEVDERTTATEGSSVESPLSPEVFCKVWHEDDINLYRPNVHEEMNMLSMANSHGVPSAYLLTDLSALHVKIPTAPDATYHVITMARMRRDPSIMSNDIPDFARLLIQAVRKLHDVGILHWWDIKPDNIA